MYPIFDKLNLHFEKTNYKEFKNKIKLCIIIVNIYY